MHHSARSLAFLALVLAAACGGSEDRSAQARASVDDGALLLDVRTPAEFAAGHLEGAFNVPVGELSSRLEEVPAGRDVVVYCRSGYRSARAATLLREHGHAVIDLGAMDNWSAPDEAP